MDLDDERKHYAKCGRREVSRQAFMAEMGISEDDVKSPEDVETCRSAQAAPAPISVTEMKELGNRSFQNGQYCEAIQCFTEALEGEPDNHMLHSNRSAAYLHCNKGHDYLTLALYDADKCIELRPNWFKGHGRRGDALMAMQQLNEACTSFEQARALAPDNKSIRKSLEKCQQLKSIAHEEARQSGVAEDADNDARLIKLMSDFNKGGTPSGLEYLASELSVYRRLGSGDTRSASTAEGLASQCTSTYNSSASIYSNTSMSELDDPRPTRGKYAPSDADISRPLSM